MDTDNLADTTQLRRRGLFRAGAVAAGLVAGTAVASSLGTPEASAANGGTAVLGQDNVTDAQSTSFTVTNPASPANDVPTVKLTNANGPSLYLSPLPRNTQLDLAVGSIANTVDGPLIGVADDQNNAYTTTLATGTDLASLPLPVATDPARLLDTRSASGRTQILDSSSSAFDSSHRLKAGAWVDINIGAANSTFTLQAAFLNVTVTGPLASGFVTAYPPGTRPTSSNLNYVKGQTIANAAFVGIGVVGTAFAVRFYSSQTTHLIVDLTGATVTAEPGPAATAGARQASAADRIQRSSRRIRSLRRALR